MHKGIKLGNLQIGDGVKPVFIGEVGINHQGSKDLALEMVDALVEAGADIIKFQHHLPEHEMVKSHVWYELMVKCGLHLYELEELKAYVELQGAEFLCTPFCIEAAADLASIGVKGFKTGSGESNHLEFHRHIAYFGRSTIISTGMSSRNELIQTLDAVRRINPQVVLMNCTSTYPCLPSEARLRRIQWLRSTFNVAVGQSDHTPTISTALGAIALGAVAIEKHVTLDRNMEGPDHSGSILPGEFKQLKEMGLEIWEAMQMSNEAEMGVLASEKAVKQIANHHLDEVTGRVLRTGQPSKVYDCCGRPDNYHEHWCALSNVT